MIQKVWKKMWKKLVFLAAIALLMLFIPNSSNADAGNICMIKVPLTAKLCIKGVMQDDSKIVKSECVNGRIHEIAAQNTGVVYGYSQYMIANLASPEEVAVYDINRNPVAPTYANVGIIDYTGANDIFYDYATKRVQECVIAYNKRLNDKMWDYAFSQYFLNGSNAYKVALASADCRRWGQFVSLVEIVSVDVSEIYPYTTSAFTAKATVRNKSLAVGNRECEEVYDMYVFLQHNGTDFYVTDFTFMP